MANLILLLDLPFFMSGLIAKHQIQNNFIINMLQHRYLIHCLKAEKIAFTLKV